jgi:hypothetical protein
MLVLTYIAIYVWNANAAEHEAHASARIRVQDYVHCCRLKADPLFVWRMQI